MRALHTAATEVPRTQRPSHFPNNIANWHDWLQAPSSRSSRICSTITVSLVGTQTSDAMQTSCLFGIDSAAASRPSLRRGHVTQGTIMPTAMTSDVAIRGDRLFQDPDAGRHVRLQPRTVLQMGRSGPHLHAQGNVVFSSASRSARTRRRRHQPQGQVSWQFVSARPRRRARPAPAHRAFINRRVASIGDNLSTEPPASGTAQDGRPIPTAWAICSRQSRTGQGRSCDRDFRSDRGSRALRVNAKSKHRRRSKMLPPTSNMML